MGGMGLGLRLGMNSGFSGEPNTPAGPTYLAFERDPASFGGGVLTSGGDGSYTSTRTAQVDSYSAELVRSTTAIAGDCVFEMEMTVLAPTTSGFMGIDDASPALATFQNGAGTVMGVLPAADGYLYAKKPGDTTLANVLGGWGAAVGSKVFIVRIGTTLTLRSGTGTYDTAAIKATTTDTGARYAGWDHRDGNSAFKFRFFAI